MDPPERLARGVEIRLDGRERIEPGALHAGDGPVASGHGGDQGGQAAGPVVLAVAQRRVKAQRREAAMREPPGAQVAFRVGAVDGAALAPQAPGRGAGVPACATKRSRRCRQRQKGSRLGERRAQRGRSRAVANDIEQVAVFAGGGVGPFAGRARAVQAHVQRAPAGAVEIPGHPITALAAAVGQVAAADGFGATRERGGGLGGVHGAAPGRNRDKGHEGLRWAGGSSGTGRALPPGGAGRRCEDGRERCGKTGRNASGRFPLRTSRKKRGRR